MASNWDANWEDEEWLKRQNAATLHSIFREAEAQGKDSAKIKNVVVEKLHAVTDFKEVNSYDLLAFLKVADDADLTVTGADNQPRDLKAEMDNVIEARTADLENKTDLISRLNYKALLEAKKITKKDDAEAVASLGAATNSSAVSISDTMENIQEITDAEFDAFDNADKAGALDDVSNTTKEAFIKKLAELSGWDKTDGRMIEINDNALLNAVTSLDVYKEDGSLNDVYADCAELADRLTFEYPEGTTDAQKADLAKAYKQQLLANAAMRTTNEILKDRTFILRHKTAEDILAAYKGEVARQFERSVVVAGLTTSQATGIMLDKITRNKDTGKIEYDGGADAAVTQAIADVLEGKSPINPLTLQMDTYQLDIENRKVEKALKLKKLDAEKLGFRQKASKIWNAAKENIIKKGGWKKIAVNAAVFVGASAAMASGSALLIGTGAALYAGWTAVNAWVMPAYDSLSNEMYEKKTKGFKARLAYLKQNFSRAFKAKREEPGFMKRAWWRTAEGAVVGGLTGGMGFLGITGWTKVFSRQGTMAAGKTGSFIRSLFARKKAKKELETTYSMDNFKVLQTAEGYLKQDKVALAAVIGGAVVADYFKYDFENGGPVAQAVGNIKSLVSENSAAPVEAAETPDVPEPKTSAAEVSEVKDDAGNVLETRTVTTDAEGNKVVEVKDTEGNVIGKGTQRWISSSNQTETEITYEDGRKITETVTAEGNKTVTTEYPNGVKTSQQVDAEGQVASETTEFDASKLSGDEKRMYLNSVKKWGQDEVNNFYASIASGNVETIPEGMNPVEFVDKLTRMAQLAPHEQRAAIEIMTRDLSCEDFHPSAEQIEVVKNALNTIIYEKGARECVIFDAEGRPCVKTMSLFGQYVGKQQMVQMEIDGEMKILPLRTANVTLKLGAEVNCGNGTATVTGIYEKHNIPGCGCDKGIDEEFSPIPLDTPKPQQDVSSSEVPIEAWKDTTQRSEATEILVNFRDPSSRATACLSSSRHDYDITGNIPEGAEYLKMDSRGNLHLWQKGVVVAGSGNGNDIISGADGVEAIYPTALNLNMNDLGAAKVAEIGEGISFQYGKGKYALTFVLNKKSGEMRTFLGRIKDKNEIVLDQATTAKAAEALTGTMNESGLAARYHLKFGDENEQNNKGLSAYIKADKKAEIEKDINQDIDKAVKKGRAHGMQTTKFQYATPSYDSIKLTSDQQKQLLSDSAVITSTGIEGGKMVFAVQGVDGVNKLEVPMLQKISSDASSLTVGEECTADCWAVYVTDNFGLEYTIENSKGAAHVYNNEGVEVFLDKKSSETISADCKKALEEKGINVREVSLTPPENKLFTKLTRIYNEQQQRSKAQIASTIRSTQR